MSPDGSETKFRKEMAKQPLTLMIRIESGVQTGIEDIHCVIPKRIRLPIPPPIATKKYLLIKTIRYCAHLQYSEITFFLKVTIGPDTKRFFPRLRKSQNGHYGENRRAASNRMQEGMSGALIHPKYHLTHSRKQNRHSGLTK